MPHEFSVWTWPMVCLATVRTPNSWRAHPWWPAWLFLVQSQIHEEQVIQYHLHSSQVLQPAGSQSDHKDRRDTSELPRLTRTSMAPGSCFGLPGHFHQVGGHWSLSQLLRGDDDADLVPLCVILLALRIWHHQYFLNGTMQCIKSQGEIWVTVLLINNYLINIRTRQHTTDFMSVWVSLCVCMYENINL